MCLEVVMEKHKKIEIALLLLIYFQISVPVECKRNIYIPHTLDYNCNTVVGPRITITMGPQKPLFRRIMLHFNGIDLNVTTTKNSGLFSTCGCCNPNYAYIPGPVHLIRRYRLNDQTNNCWRLMLCTKRHKAEWEKSHIKKVLPDGLQQSAEQEYTYTTPPPFDKNLSKFEGNKENLQKVGPKNSSDDDPQHFIAEGKKFKTLMYAAKQYSKMLMTQKNDTLNNTQKNQ